jgi:hypothetical protein
MLVWVGCLCAAALVQPTTALAAPGQRAGQQAPTHPVRSLDALLDGLSTMPGLRAEFREEKRMALLAQPLVNEGTLHFSAGKLARHTSLPMRSSLVIRDGRMEFGDESGSDSLDLDANPVIRLFVDSFVKIFAGDKSALERIYRMEFSQNADGWKLVLRPKVEPMNKVIDHLELEGRGLVLTRMRVLEVGGDETLTTFEKVDVNRRYTTKEIAQVFSVRR